MTTEGFVREPAEESENDLNLKVSLLQARRPVRSTSRARRNIREWNSYLPADCVARMIAMGWDFST